MQVVVRRSARLPPPPVPQNEVLVSPPPRLERAQAGATGWLQYLVPVIGSLGAVLFVLVNPKPIYVVSGLLFALAAVAMGVGMAVQQQLSARARTAAARSRYQGYLAELRAEARAVAEQQRAAAAWRHPAPDSLWTVARSAARRWERRPDDADFLELRVGEGCRPLATALRLESVTDPLSTADPVAEEAVGEFIAVQGSVRDQPLTVSLTGARVVSLVGARPYTLALARALLAQVAALHAPDDVRLMFCLAPGTHADWEWAKWLPHLRAGGGVASDPVELEAAADEFSAGAHPWLVAVTDGVLPAPRTLDPLRRDGCRVTVVNLVEDQQAEPSAVDVRLRLEPGGHLLVESAEGGDPLASGLADRLGSRGAEALARRLAPLRLSPVPGRRSLADGVPLADLLGVDDFARLDPSILWNPRPLRESLRLPIGLSPEGQPVVLDLKEAALSGHGPHGLVIGATGSGKSELLRTVVTGLALRHSPELLAFVLVDFKGGAAFAGLSELPHVAGMLTNLSDDLALVDRMRTALSGEIRRRQELLKRAGNLSSLRDYHRRRAADPTLEPLPYLMVIVDEFGELLASRPEFIDLFVAAGRLGRSLGMHLLLASQQLEEGRLRGLEGHISYRIALRTFSAQESRTVLGVPDAYELPPVPGSGYLKVGTRVYTRFRAALVSQAHSAPGPAARPWPPHPLPFTLGALERAQPAAAEPAPLEEEAGGGRSALELAVGQLRAAAPRAHQVWLPPLEARVALSAVLDRRRQGRGALTVPLGLVDRPAEQRREVLTVDLSGPAGHLLVAGGPQTGKSTLLRTFIGAFALTHTPLEAQFYCVDYGGGALGALAGLPHVGEACGRHDPERLRRTVAEVSALLEDRERRFQELGIDSPAAMREWRGDRSREGFADVFLVVDDWPAVRQQFEELEAPVQDIATRGLGYGIHLVLTAGRWIDVRSSLRDAIGGRLELRLHDPGESAIDRKAAANLPAGIPGRGLNAEALQFQAALPRIDGRPSALDLPAAVGHLVARVAGDGSGPRAPRVRVLPGQLALSQLPAPGADLDRGVPIGIGERDLCPVYLDLAGADPHLLVLGDGESGKSSLLTTYLRGLITRRSPSQAQILLLDYRRSLLDVVPSEYLMGYAGAQPASLQQVTEAVQALSRRLPGPGLPVEQLRNRSWWTGADAYVVVDDYDLVATPPDPLEQLLPLLAQARDIGLHLLVTHRVGGAGRALYQSILLRLKELGTPTILLSGDPQEGVLLGGHRAAPQPPGRGVLIRRRDRPAILQIALPDP